VLDILPTVTLYEETDAEFATAYWEWFFFIQRDDFPEALIGAAPERFLRYELGPVVAAASWRWKLGTSIGAALAIHPRSTRCARTIGQARRSIWRTTAVTSTGTSPAPCSSSGVAENPIWTRFDMLDSWRQWAGTVTGEALPCSHYLPEEAPDATYSRLHEFFSE
jgi:haloacetate dehalogenase